MFFEIGFLKQHIEIGYLKRFFEIFRDPLAQKNRAPEPEQNGPKTTRISAYSYSIPNRILET